MQCTGRLAYCAPALLPYTAGGRAHLAEKHVAGVSVQRGHHEDAAAAVGDAKACSRDCQRPANSTRLPSPVGGGGQATKAPQHHYIHIRHLSTTTYI